jgi:hypothetical protein
MTLVSAAGRLPIPFAADDVFDPPNIAPLKNVHFFRSPFLFFLPRCFSPLRGTFRAFSAIAPGRRQSIRLLAFPAVTRPQSTHSENDYNSILYLFLLGETWCQERDSNRRSRWECSSILGFFEHGRT